MLSSFPSRRRHLLLLLVISAAAAPLVAAHGEHSPACPFSTPAGSDREDHHHHHNHDHDHLHLHDHHFEHRREMRSAMLPEELAEEEDLMLEGFDHHHHHHHHDHGDRRNELSPIGIWVRAMGCSLLVSLASLICLAILPVILLQGKLSKSLVDSLAVFGAGAMLGDAFLHQLPHAFGGQHSHSHEHHEHHLEHGHSHSHSLEDLSVGLSILGGIVLFFLVEKVVRYVEDNSVKGAYGMGHGHHHHHHKHHDKLKDDSENHDDSNSKLDEPKDTLNDAHHGCQNDENHTEHETLLRKRATRSGATNDDKEDLNAGNGLTTKKSSLNSTTPPSNLVFGYLNLFSDGVHNFTDGMALGSAFLLHGSVGGWSRTLFLLAHELPQEVGDFGILVRSGFSVSKALFFNFLSALVALAGTALALVLGKDPGQSSLIEGFTAGGFIYIAVAGVLPQMNDGKTTFRSTATQLTSLMLGMAVALCISLIE
ncbi:IAA-alanine resistance protein 1 isoform X2 [Phoenix dactylifera]|uniref:IAA-alanine resistance protein 1 isoform X2 n=1 Tax=Phoenix dactylifera TaxID=42345 RepID=A0A8B9AU26_PHODC|nr:IAA-alanine resistance protein 1 isoform X2 [Phoenix dactylifera]